MSAVVNALDLSHFRVTEDYKSFSKPNIGALYFPPHERFTEITQNVLDLLVEKNHLKPLDGYDDKYLEFFPNEIFIETAFKDISQAEHFIKNVFNHFDMPDSNHCTDIISKLQTFTSIISPKKKLNCRFEIIAGNSCKRFHVDSVDARLIYTCAGPGTQIKRPDEKQFITLPSGSALIVKGENYQDFKEVTLHRSPPIEGTNTKRFLFIADYQ
jgi:hypothetical protein